MRRLWMELVKPRFTLIELFFITLVGNLIVRGLVV